MALDRSGEATDSGCELNGISVSEIRSATERARRKAYDCIPGLRDEKSLDPSPTFNLRVTLPCKLTLAITWPQ